MTAFQSAHAFDAATHGPFALMLALAALSIVTAGSAAALIGARLTRPLQRLNDTAHAIAAGLEPAAEESPSRVREFNALNASLRRASRVVRRRAAAERLALHEARNGHELLASVVDGTADQIMVKDTELRFVLANKPSFLLPFMTRQEWQILGRR